MKILALTNLYPPHFVGGYELICAAVLPELQRRGHHIQVLTSSHRVPGAETQKPELGVERSLRIHGFYGHPWLGIPALLGLEQHNNETLRGVLKRFRPDLVYVWNMGGLSKSMLFTLQDENIPTVFYLSDHWIARGLSADVWLNWWNNPNSNFKQKAARRMLTRLGFRTQWDKVAPTRPTSKLVFRRLYFCSKALRTLTAEAGWDVEHGEVIYCPVDIHKFNGEPRRAHQPLRRLLYVGRLAADKGVMTALRAFQALKGRFNGTLTIHGYGDLEYVEGLKKYVREHELPVTFSSGRQDDVPAVYAAHDALLFTSEWVEPFALTPLEAMSCGLPVIGTTTGGSKELFRHRENSLTYTAGHSEELTQQILELAADPVLRERIAETGWQEVRNRYSETKIVDQIELYLEETGRTWSHETSEPSTSMMELHAVP